MKSKSSYLFGAIALGLVAMIIWTASLTAQQAANPNTTRVKQPTPLDATRFKTRGVVVPQNQYPARNPYGAPIQGQALPGLGGLPTLALPPDAKTAELIGAYLLKQSEINQLVKKYGEAKGEGDKNSLRDEIVQATNAQFDLQQQVRAREIEKLKKRLADVETTVEQRNELKDQIVEKRVADILREPDQLQWEPLDLATAPNGARFPPPPTEVTPSRVVPYYAPLIPSQRKTYSPRTVWEEVDGPPKVVPVPDAAFPALDLSDMSPVPEPGNHRQLAPAGSSIAEAEARVRIAQQKRDVTHSRFETGQVLSTEMIASDGELELAKLVLARVKAEYAARTKLLELDVRQAEGGVNQATAALREAQELNKRSPHALPATQMEKRKAAVEQASIELERAKTYLEIHQKSNQPQELPVRQQRR